MKLLFYATYFQPAWDWGGPVRSTWHLVRAVARLGVEVVVVTTDARQHGKVEAAEAWQDGVTIVRSPVLLDGRVRTVNRFGLAPRMGGELLRWLRWSDVLHIEGPWGWAHPLLTAGARWIGVPYVMAARGNLDRYALKQKRFKKSAYMTLTGRRDLSGAAKVMFATALERDEAPAWLARERCCVIPNVVDVAPAASRSGLRRHLGISNESVLAGIFGRVHRHKGFEFVFECLRSVASTDLANLVVVGPEEGAEGAFVRDLASRFGVADRLRFLGMLEGKELQDAYAGVDVALMPSYGESFGNVAIEAVVQGTPVIVSERVGVGDWLVAAGAGRKVARDLGLWLTALKDLRKMKDCAWERRNELRAAVAAAFSPEAVGQVALDCYSSAVGGKQRAQLPARGS